MIKQLQLQKQVQFYFCSRKSQYVQTVFPPTNDDDDPTPVVETGDEIIVDTDPNNSSETVTGVGLTLGNCPKA